MSLFLERKFVTLVSSRLNQFKRRGPDTWNFRCPFCGDSKRNKVKTRGYLYERGGSIHFHCHNCLTSHHFKTFLKRVDHQLFTEYQMEEFQENRPPPREKVTYTFTPPMFKKTLELPTIASLTDTHIAKDFLLKRKIPREKFSELYFALNFAEFAAELQPQMAEKKLKSEPRIVIPFYDENKNLLGVQGRALSKSEIKYITVKIEEGSPKIFGLDRVDFSKRIYVVEGPIDSLFLSNSLATMDAALYSIILAVGDHDYVFVHDNEPRNSQIVKIMEKTISMGKNICIWPQNIVEKDINDMILGGMPASAIQAIIDKRTFSGLTAQLEFNVWRKK